MKTLADVWVASQLVPFGLPDSDRLTRLRQHRPSLRFICSVFAFALNAAPAPLCIQLVTPAFSTSMRTPHLQSGPEKPHPLLVVPSVGSLLAQSAFLPVGRPDRHGPHGVAFLECWASMQRVPSLSYAGGP